MSDNRIIEHLENRPNVANTRSAKHKQVKETQNMQKKRKQPRFGICFDVDGVLARGTIPLDSAVKAMKKLVNDQNEFRVPVSFVTNALNKNSDKAAQINSWFGTNVLPRHMIQAQGPLELFTEFHNKFCLLIGQGKITEIATELGFKDFCTLEDVTEAYPLLDMINHDNRRRIARDGYEEKELRRIEAVILMGEPKRWESSLQVLVDLLKTDGKPSIVPDVMPESHLPIVACNMDLQFMDRACMPRYGHGAYLVCLEALFKKVTGKDLKYTSLAGKPSEITFRFAEHVLSRETRTMGNDETIKRMYMIGDTPDVDIVGSNLYQRFIDRLRNRSDGGEENKNGEGNNSGDGNKSDQDCECHDAELPSSRQIPQSAKFSKQTVEKIESVLVCTGVYKPDGPLPEESCDEKHYHGHRDFPMLNELLRPTKIMDNVADAIDYILEKEHFSS